MIAMCLTTLALVAAEASATPMTLTVVAARDVPDSLVSRICAEAEAVWEPAGLALACDRQPSKDNPWTIAVTIDDQRMLAGRADALGWLTFTSDGPARSIHLSRASAEALLRHAPGVVDATISSHEDLIGRALGRALAHELGHYIFRSKAHTPRGLMRAVWTSDEIFGLSRDGFELTLQERESAAGCLRMQTSCCT